MNINDYSKGWIVGNFHNSLIKSKDIEIAVKKYKAGDKDKTHHHKIATEYTIIISGIVKMMGKIWKTDDIVIIEPNTKNTFECIEDACLLVIKTPSVIDDKYVEP